MFSLPQGLKKFSSIFKRFIESTLRRIKGVVVFQDDVLLYGTTGEQYENECLRSEVEYVRRVSPSLKTALNQSQALVSLVTQFQRKE